MRIEFPEFPTRVPVTKTRRPRYFLEGDPYPKKLQNARYYFKNRKLWDREEKKFVIKNASTVNEPRYAPISYNAISGRQKITILVKLKEYMRPLMPEKIDVPTPWRIQCEVHDLPLPFKDLDNFHIYFKGFMDLLKGMGFIKDDSKQYITEAGGFTYVPVNHIDERKLVFKISHDNRDIIHRQIMFRLEPRVVIRNGPAGVQIVAGHKTSTGVDIKLGDFIPDKPLGDKLMCNLGKQKISAPAVKACFKKLFTHAVNNNIGYWCDSEFYRIHSDKLQKELLDKGVSITINVK